MPLLLLALLLAQSADFEAAGKKALEAHDYAEAIAAFRQAAAADPKDYAAHFNLGFAYTMSGKDAEAVDEYKTVLALHPGVFEAQLNLGVSLLRLDRFVEAETAYRGALSIKVDSAAAEEGLGRALARQQAGTGSARSQNPPATQEGCAQPDSVVRTCSSEARTGPARTPKPPGTQEGCTEPGSVVRACSSAVDKLAEAELHYRKAVALDPTYRDSLLDLAALYEGNHRSTEAIAILREFPADPAAQEHMGALLLESGHSADAIPPLEFAVAKSPTQANRLALAQAYAKEKQLAKAEPLAAAALAQTPGDDAMRMFYGRLLRDQRKFMEAAAQFQEVTVRQPQSVEAWNELAGVYLVADKFQEALASFDRVRALGAETTPDFFFRALAHDRLHQAKDALDNYNRFLAASKGAFPDQEFQARQRVLALEKELGKR